MCLRMCKGHFPAEEALVYVLARESGRKSWLQKESINRHGRCTDAYAVFMTSSRYDNVLVGPDDEALPALLILMGSALPCQKGCVCQWMQMAL